MKRVGGADQRSRALAYAFNQVPQPVRPGPLRLGLLEALPAAGAVLPDFVAVRVPIVPEQIDRAVGAVKFDTRPTVLLDVEAGGDDRQAAALARMFVENSAAFADAVPDSVRAAGPRVRDIEAAPELKVAGPGEG